MARTLVAVTLLRCWFLLCAPVCAALAEQLLTTVFSARDGLPATTTPRIVVDSKGFVWFPTSGGLARFDGNGFRLFGEPDGLPATAVSDILERPDGTYWIAAQGFICLYDPRPHRQRFRCESPGIGVVNTLLEDEQGLWCGADNGLWRRGPRQSSWIPVRALEPSAPNRSIAVQRLLKDSRGDVWAATYSGLYRFRPDGPADRWTHAQGLLYDAITAVAETPGAIWAGSQTELIRLHVDPRTREARIAHRYDRSHGLPSSYIVDVRFWRGEVWAATFHGLARQLPSGRWQAVELDPSVRSLPLETLAVDRLGNLWAGTDGGGAARISGSGFSSFSERDGLGIRKVWAMLEDQGALLAVAKDEGHYSVNRFDGYRFHSIRPHAPSGISFGWSWSQILLHSKAGDWWMGTGAGLLRYPARFEAAPRLQGPDAGLPIGNIFRVFEDSRGAIWASRRAISNNALFRRARGAQRFQTFDQSHGLPSLHDNGNCPAAFAEDRAGNIWIGMNEGSLVRFAGRRFQQFPASSGSPQRGVRALLIDHLGRLWIGTRRDGLLRVDNPAAAQPLFSAQTRPTNSALAALAEDLSGRIYAASGSGVDRFDPASGRVRRFTAADGLLPGEIRAAFRDRHGAVWFGGDQGLFRIQPQEDRSDPPVVLVYSVRVNGQPRPISDLGDPEPPALAMSPSERQVQVDFGGFRHDLLYQTRLSGVDRDWTPPSPSRGVHYLSLAPGGYDLLIRAIAPEGSMSPQPARVRFRIAAPVWQRWWFLLSVAAAAAALAYGAHRTILQRRLAVERTRARIATDLHDDIGSSLARTSVLSEVLKSRVDPGQDASRVIDQIATSARDLIEGLNDIVWSIDPRLDTLGDVVARIRRYASDVFDPSSIEWTFDAPQDAGRLSLSPEQRRHLLLIFKEAIHNIVRHSACRRASLRILLEGGHLEAAIGDDGRGIPAEYHGGRGLASMRLRAGQLGGRLDVVPNPEGGTELRLRFPVA
ncbi:MAG: hypothetical protein HYR60_01850 [Acidobacteria bacterium]|nr:hypothetical protein [Acidobacteriota bacterium]